MQKAAKWLGVSYERAEVMPARYINRALAAMSIEAKVRQIHEARRPRPK